MYSIFSIAPGYSSYVLVYVQLFSYYFHLLAIFFRWTFVGCCLLGSPSPAEESFWGLVESDFIGQMSLLPSTIRAKSL